MNRGLIRVGPFFTLLVFLFWGGQSTFSHAVEIQPQDNQHSGMVTDGNFIIYPQNRLGNGLYRDNNLLVSKTDQMIIGSQPVKGTESAVYLFQGRDQELGLGLVNGENEGMGRLKKVGKEFYEFSNYEIGYQRIFRILQGRIVPVLENLRTATGVTLSETHAVFYHITESSSSSNAEDNAKPKWNYRFRLHLVRLGEPQVVTLYQLPLEDQNAKLRISWKNEHELIHRKRDGSEETLNLQKISPGMF